MTRPYPVVGITGPARSGKDTARQFILACTGGYAYSFADPIYAMVLAGLGLDLRDQYWQERKEDVIPLLGKSPRQLLQTLGTEWGRQLVHGDLWLIMAQQALLRNGIGMVIADVRFENEADWVRNNGGRILHIRRKDAVVVNPHASEAGVEIKDQDHVVLNNGTLEEFQDKIRGIFDGSKT